MAIRQHGIGQGTGKHPADHHRQHHFCPRRQLLPVQRPQDPLFGRTSAKIRVLQRMPAGIRPVQQGLGILHPPVRVQKPQYMLIAGGLRILDHKPPGQPGQRIEPMEDRRRCKQLQNHVIPAAHMGQFMQQNILGALRLPLHLDRAVRSSGEESQIPGAPPPPWCRLPEPVFPLLHGQTGTPWP